MAERRFCESSTARCGGECGAPIESADECEAAAAALGSSDTTATVERAAEMPAGCYLHQLSAVLPVKSLKYNAEGTTASTTSFRKRGSAGEASGSIAAGPHGHGRRATRTRPPCYVVATWLLRGC